MVSMKKSKILIIDDSSINISLLSSILELDYNVYSSTSALEALVLLDEDEHLPNLILLDVVMPVMNGYQFLECLKDNPKLSDIPVIFITANDSESSEVEGFRLGAVDFITKPISSEIVNIRVQTHLRLQKQKSEISQQQQLLQSIFEAMSDGVMVCDKHGYITAINSQLSVLWPNIDCSVLGSSVNEVFQQFIFPYIEQEKTAFGGISEQIRDEGSSPISGVLDLSEQQHYRFISKPLEKYEEHKGYIICFYDMSAEVNLRKNLEKIAITDELTSLYNRRYFNHIIQRELSITRNKNRMLGLLIVDIDFFKKINDTYGHTSGDEVLARVAKDISLKLRSVDFCFRYGGEEFAILLPDTTIEGIIDVGKRIMASVAALELGGLQITVSIGATPISLSTDDEICIDTVVNRADKELYVAKENGRNRMFLSGYEEAILC